MTAPPVDRFDEMRRAWIAAHQGASTIQRRRAELFGRRIRVRQRAVATAVPDPHDDSVIPPLWLRTAKSLASQLELFVVTVAALVIPLGWVGGRLLKRLSPNPFPCAPSRSRRCCVGCPSRAADRAGLRPRPESLPGRPRTVALPSAGRRTRRGRHRDRTASRIRCTVAGGTPIVNSRVAHEWRRLCTQGSCGTSATQRTGCGTCG